MRSIIGSNYFILGLTAIIFVIGGFLYINNPEPIEYETEEPVVCAQDALLCPDGSYVGRVAPDCQFQVCPLPPEGTQFEDGTIPDTNTDLEEETVFCTMDAMQCPDGSYVGRTGPNCEFVCP